MRKIAYIPLGFFVALPVSLWLTSFYPIEVEHYKEGSNPYYVAGFDKRVASYQSSSNDTPKTVLVGPSYAVALGEVGSIYNLGSVGATYCETAAIVSAYCRKNDHIFYAVTVWDYILGSTLVRLHSVNTVYRRLFLLREYISPAKEIPGAPWSTSYFDSIKVSDEEFQSVLRAFEAEGVTNCPADIGLLIKRLKHYGPMIKRCFYEQWEPDLSHYRQLHHEFPNTVFIMFPSVPLRPMQPADSDLAHIINIILAAKAKLKVAFEKSALPYADFSEPELLSDVFHSTQEGNDLLRERLSQLSESLVREELESL